MVVMRYVECQLHHETPCLICGRLSFPSCPTYTPSLFSLLPLSTPSLPPSLLSLPPSSLYLPPPTQGDDPLNSADDDEDSDGEGAHFDTEDNIVCQFEKVCCSPEYCGGQHPRHCVTMSHPWVLPSKHQNL